MSITVRFSRLHYAYDAAGSLTTTTDSAGNVVTMGYDIRGRKIAMSDPDMGNWTYVYDAFGQLVSQTDAKSQTATMAYDVLGRLTSRVETEGTTTWTFDAAPVAGVGKLNLVTAPGGYSRVHSFDTLGRPATTATNMFFESYSVSQSYDSEGRPHQTTYPTNPLHTSGFVLERNYTTNGHLLSIAAPGGTTYWEADTVNADGQITRSLLGNGLITDRTYDANTGLVQTIQTGDGTTATIQDLGYTFDGLGNLTVREDFRENAYEEFAYDSLNRVTAATVKNGTTEAILENKSYAYDTIGNLITKSDVSALDYVYGTGNATGAGDAGPHAVTSAGGNTYVYDDNGNQTSGDGRTLTWTSYNKPTSIANGSSTSAFVYGPNRARIRHVVTTGANVRTTKYVGGAFEKVTETGKADEYRYTVNVGDRVAQVTIKDDAPATEDTKYFHTDHLGSIDTVSDSAGVSLERMSFDPFGKRRETTWQDAALPIAGVETKRGFTDHEHLDEVGLIHMNGQVYDPVLGRFLSADPFVQFPKSTQGFNRYTYVNNNPLSFTDPSGFGILSSIGKFLNKTIGKVVKAVGGAAAKAVKSDIGRAVIAIGFASVPGLQPALAGALGGFVASGGDLKSTLLGAATGQLFSAIGGLNELGTVGKAVAHGVVGGVRSEIEGGRFATGFLSAAVAKLGSSAIQGQFGENRFAGAAATAVLGGTVSVLDGGKFANGP